MRALSEFTFYLGTHEPQWLSQDIGPLFLSHRRLARTRHLPRASTTWALDSGAFTELARYGRWTITVNAYASAVRAYGQHIGRLAWAAPMDWPCDPRSLSRSHLSIREHQTRTVHNLIRLRDYAPDLPFIPVLQGWRVEDFDICLAMYDRAGIHLPAEPIVGVGSLCSRQGTHYAKSIVSFLANTGITLHGFGVKAEGLALYASLLSSADSMAWSLRARYSDPLPECRHARCNNCRIYAAQWRRELLSDITLGA